MDATVAGAVVKLRLDISTGDSVAPPPTIVDYPTLRTEHPRRLSATVLVYAAVKPSVRYPGMRRCNDEARTGAATSW
jgi:hypothetical protein